MAVAAKSGDQAVDLVDELRIARLHHAAIDLDRILMLVEKIGEVLSGPQRTIQSRKDVLDGLEAGAVTVRS